MRESVVENPNLENKMGESIAFGKFENDSLSWEKWSSFSPNKYLEEVGSLSTPGSVAQKKAYFEAHYKKIAAQKAELLELEKPLETDPSISHNNQNITDHTECSSISSDQSSVKEVEIDNNAKSSNKTVLSELKECDFKNQTSVEEANEELNGKLDSHEFDDKEEIALIKDETLLKESQKEEDVIEKDLELDGQNISQKVTSTEKEQNLDQTKKKKPVSTIPKLANTSTKKSSKPEIKSTLISQSRSTAEKSSVSPLLRSKNATARATKRVAPKTLHMSLNLDLSNSSSDPPPSLTTIRRSLFMEKMGDKDIVKRAFKTFQNNFNQLKSSTNEYSSGHKETHPLGHAAVKGIEQKVSTSNNSRKENERMRNIGEKMNIQRSRLGTTWNSVSSGSLKEAGLDGRKSKVSSSSIGSRSDDVAEKQKEFVNKVAEKSYGKETEKTRLSLKSKVGVKSGISRRPQVA